MAGCKLLSMELKCRWDIQIPDGWILPLPITGADVGPVCRYGKSSNKTVVSGLRYIDWWRKLVKDWIGETHAGSSTHSCTLLHTSLATVDFPMPGLPTRIIIPPAPSSSHSCTCLTFLGATLWARISPSTCRCFFRTLSCLEFAWMASARLLHIALIVHHTYQPNAYHLLASPYMQNKTFL